MTGASSGRTAEDARPERNVKTNLASFGLVELEATGMIGGPSDDETQPLAIQYYGQLPNDGHTGGLVLSPVTYITTSLPDSLLKQSTENRTEDNTNKRRKV